MKVCIHTSQDIRGLKQSTSINGILRRDNFISKSKLAPFCKNVEQGKLSNI